MLEKSELPALQLKFKNGDGDAAKIQRRILDNLEKQMAEYHAQEERQYELLETNPNYPPEVFERRNAVLRQKMEECQKQIYQAKAAMPKSVDYSERVAALQAAVDVLKDPNATPAEKNRLLKAIVERIEFTGSPSDHLNRKRNKRNENAFSLKIFLRV